MEPVNVGFLWFLEKIVVNEISWNHFSHPPRDETENHQRLFHLLISLTSISSEAQIGLGVRGIRSLLPKSSPIRLSPCRRLSHNWNKGMAHFASSISAGMNAFDFHWKKNETPTIELIEFYEQNTINYPSFIIYSFFMSKEVAVCKLYHG